MLTIALLVMLGSPPADAGDRLPLATIELVFTRFDGRELVGTAIVCASASAAIVDERPAGLSVEDVRDCSSKTRIPFRVTDYGGGVKPQLRTLGPLTCAGRRVSWTLFKEPFAGGCFDIELSVPVSAVKARTPELIRSVTRVSVP